MGSATRHPNAMRERFREQVREDVKAIALEQLAEGGAQAVSVNAVAKRLGVSGPALYRYFAGRDELLTALIVDAYADLHDALVHGVEAAPGDAADRLRALARSYRGWALEQPHRYELLFRPPLPGYDAHAEPLVGASRSLMVVALDVVDGLDRPDRADRPRPHDHDGVLAARTAGTASYQLAVAVWSRLHGFVSLELGGAFSAMRLDTEALFENEVQVLAARLVPDGSGT